MISLIAANTSGGPAAIYTYVQSGKLRTLGSWGVKPYPAMPDVPTFKEQGYPDLEIYIWAAISAPAGTPDAVIGRLNAEFVKALQSPEVRDKWRAMDFETLPSTPDELNRFMAADSKRWAEAVRISGFKAAE